MKNLLVIVTCLMLSSCSLNPFGGMFQKKPEKIPQAPYRDFWESEDIRKNAKILDDASDQVYTSGANAQDYASTVIKDSADVMTVVMGVPAEEIDWKDPKQVKELHDRIRANEEILRERQFEWKEKLDAMSRDTELLQKENDTLRKFKNWFWLSVIALGALTFFFPTVGIGIIKFLVGRAKRAGEVALQETSKGLQHQFKQVTDAIEEYKHKSPEEAGKLLEELNKKTDSHTRDLIKKIKRGDY
jgi:hypothetical protein